ncbi:MAG TPA: hypothetical protein VIQ51_06575 [Chryseosolibacter sp.]
MKIIPLHTFHFAEWNKDAGDQNTGRNRAKNPQQPFLTLLRIAVNFLIQFRCQQALPCDDLPGDVYGQPVPCRVLYLLFFL